MSPVLGQIYAPFFHLGLTTPRRENRKIRHEIEILKSKGTRSLCVGTSDQSNDN
jgi:hypothetical protein